MKTIREQMELHATVPFVELNFRERIDFIPPLDEYDLMATGQKIGECTLTSLAEYSQPSLSFMDVRLAETHRGQDYGLGTYVTAIEHAHEQGLLFASGTSVSESALKVWGRLIQAGVAEVVRPPKLLGVRKDGQRKFDCLLIVQSPSNGLHR